MESENKSEYDQQAENFLSKTKTEFKAKFIKNGLHFIDDKQPRDIYKITLKRGDREFKFNFGQSISDSEKGIKPRAYEVLACLQKYEVGSFADFCGEFGYNEDSRKAEKIYKAVLNEFMNLQRLYSDEEINLLREIQ